jgi:hypothetical protein
MKREDGTREPSIVKDAPLRRFAPRPPVLQPGGRFSVLVLTLFLLAGACTSGADETTSTTATTAIEEISTTTIVAERAALDEDGFYLALIWRQRQPLYSKDENGIVTRPWVRLHAAKDY